MASRKYLISFDQAPPLTSFVKTNIAVLERQPFDGCVMSFNATHPVYGSVYFQNYAWTANSFPWSAFAGALSDLQTIDFVKFQHNFVRFQCVSVIAQTEPPVDWFDANFEKTVINNFRMTCRLAKEGFLRGVFFDQEPTNATTGWKLFCYTDRPLTGSKTFQQYKDRAKYWGKRMVEVAQEEYPEMNLLLTLGYWQAYKTTNPPASTDIYGLLADFLDGMFDAATGPFVITDMYEDGYPHYQTSDLTADAAIIATPAYKNTNRYNGRIQKGLGTYPDYPAGTTFDTSVPANNYYDTTKVQSAIVNGFSLVSDKYIWMWQQQIKNLTVPPTTPQAYTDAYNAARITVGIDYAFDPTLVPGLALYLDPFSSALVADAAIATYTDPKGIVWTQASAGARPTYKANGFGTGFPSFLFTGASSQFLQGDAAATPFNETDGAWSVLWIAKPVANNVDGTVFSLGGATSWLNYEQRSTGRWAVDKKDDASANTTVNGAASDVSTAIQALAMVSNGSQVTVVKDNAIETTLGAQDRGTFTVSKATVGALRAGSNTSFFDGHIGTVLAYRGMLGLEQIKTLLRGMAARAGKYDL